ncbi:alpha/beta fold hydrolase [Ktedonobacter robiniae]|uniref:Alpha/beta hydrolase n=1 Tax=Ktedonobacter robiniae TaxID=2778365 RepID=A0ABQ3V163_9CHLR|nr:alpha/beta hydrolase [Ktedonobacter robiniae]GHO58385.1 alpha/beta hydrolase [Ktedonobacter robiniae]
MTTTSNTNHPAGKYAPINGINLYYELHGTGEPLIMLHGGFGTFDMFAALSPTLAQNHQIIGVDLYGHGRTALTDRPFDFEHLADDIAGLIEHLGLETADLLGYSFGGAVALQAAIRHPEQIDKLVVISTPFKRTGWHPEMQAGMASTSPEFFLGTPMHEAYMRVAPKPEDFSRFVATMREGMSQDYDWREQVAALKKNTLIIAGDSDGLPPSHAVEFFNLLGGGLRDAGWNGENLIPSQLAILPGATHYNIIFRPDLLLPVLSPFLGGTQAQE